MESKDENTIVQLDECDLQKHYDASWAFYKKIGSPKCVVAPMVNQSELAFRLLCRQYGADLCYTPMFHSRLFAQKPDLKTKAFATSPEDRPLFVQFCANDPRFLLAAARTVEGECDAVDINLGCPQGIAKRGHYGSFLLEEWPLLTRMVKELHDNLSIPVTCKIRVLDDEARTLEMCRLLQDAGCSVLCVHGRTKEMLKQSIGPCDFDIIKKIKETMKIPVIANGGIETMDDVSRCMEMSGVDGVMSSEAILEDPRLFQGGIESVDDSIALAKEYLSLAKDYTADTHKKALRPHVFKLIYRSLCVHPSLRDILHHADDDEIEKVIDSIVEKEKDWTPEERAVAYAKTTTWYRRHPHKGSPEEEEMRIKKEMERMRYLEMDEEEEEPPAFDLFG